jgi:hypothetical protein
MRPVFSWTNFCHPNSAPCAVGLTQAEKPRQAISSSNTVVEADTSNRYEVNTEKFNRRAARDVARREG